MKTKLRRITAFFLMITILVTMATGLASGADAPSVKGGNYLLCDNGGSHMGEKWGQPAEPGQHDQIDDLPAGD